MHRLTALRAADRDRAGIGAHGERARLALRIVPGESSLDALCRHARVVLAEQHRLEGEDQAGDDQHRERKREDERDPAMQRQQQRLAHGGDFGMGVDRGVRFRAKASCAAAGRQITNP
jgi:hypothetical protein